MISQHTPTLRLSGTLAKRSKPTLQPNFAKEPSSPSRSNPRTERHCSKMNKYSMTDKNGQLVTKCICHKGFSKYSSVVARSNFRIGGQVTAPQSLTAYSLNR